MEQSLSDSTPAFTARSFRDRLLAVTLRRWVEVIPQSGAGRRRWIGVSVLFAVLMLLNRQARAEFSDESWEIPEQVSAGVNHTCGVRSNGTVVCWGDDSYGQSTPPEGTFVQVSAGLKHTCAVRTDGTVACWGDNTAGQSAPLSGTFIHVSAGDIHTCGLRTDGAVACWGYDGQGRSTPPTGTFIQVSTGAEHSCALRSDGGVTCWGYSRFSGQLTPPAGTFLQVSAGNGHTCGVRSDGAVACWGSNGLGESTAPIGKFIQVSAGNYHTCGIHSDGSAECWGTNSFGQSTVPAETFTQISAGYNHTCGARSDGGVTCWGDHSYGQSTPPDITVGRRQLGAGSNHTCEVRLDGGVGCWGSNTAGQSTPPAGTFRQVSGGDLHTCGVRSDGSVGCWGDNSYGQSTPLAGTFRQISAGLYHACGVQSNGGVACWGANGYGEGDPPAGAFRQVSAGGSYACGVRAEGSVACWGDNTFGQNAAPAGAFRQVSAGPGHICGVRNNGSVVCWGDNGAGQLTAPTGTFRQVSAGGYYTCGERDDGSVVCWGGDYHGENDAPTGSFVQVSAGYGHTCGVRGDEAVTCWGSNEGGQAPQPSLTPTTLPNGAVGVAYQQTLSLTAPSYTAVTSTFQLLSGNVPGLSLNLAGVLNGTPTTAGSFPLTVTGQDANGFADEQAYTVTVTSANTFTLKIGDVSKAEGNSGTTTFSFPVTLTPASTGTVTVQYATANGTATAGSDYVTALGNVIFNPGETSKTVTVDVTGDTIVEADETFVVKLSNPSGAVVTDGQGTGTITNDDAPTLRINDASKAEGNSGSTPFTFTVTLSQASTLPVTVQYATANGTALAGSDYTATSGTLTLNPGETSKTVLVNVWGETVVEANETFVVKLSNPGGAVLAKSQGIGTITNDDAPTLRINDVSKAEGNSGFTLFTFTVTLSQASTSPVTVNYATLDVGFMNRGATAGRDYLAATGVLTFSPGQTSKPVTVKVLGDTTREENETFAVNLYNATGATIVHVRGIGTILNDDGPVLRVFDVRQAEGNSGETVFTFVVTLSPASTQTVTVSYATADSTALAGSDYLAANGSLIFSPGQINKTVTIKVKGDGIREPNEAFLLKLGNSYGATIFDNQGVGTILNDDGPVLRINDIRKLEGNNSGTTSFGFTISLSAASTSPVTVHYVTSDGTAKAGSDYTLVDRTVTIRAGQLTTLAIVPVLDDGLEEPKEWFAVNLLDATGGATIFDNQGRGTILNDD